VDRTLIFVFGMILGSILASCVSLAIRSNKNFSVISKIKIDNNLFLGPKIVVVGGGTGLSTLLSGLKLFTNNITAIVTVTDEGGSSGRLRMEWGMLPPGDIRNCLVALAKDDNALNKILNFRFDRGELKGHSLGNLMMLAMTELCGDFATAIEEMNQLLAIRGRVIPVTNEKVMLAGKLQNGEKVQGELDISSHGSKLIDLWLEPGDSSLHEEISSIISESDLIVLGPGSLFTSVLPNLLVPGFSEIIINSSVPIVYVANLMTQPGETEGFTLLDHVRWIEKLSGITPNFLLVNDTSIPEKIKKIYKNDKADPIIITDEQEIAFKTMHCAIIKNNFLNIIDDKSVRHHPIRLSEALINLTRKNGEIPWAE